MPLKGVTIGRVVFQGDTDKELFEKYFVGTVTAIADMDRVLLPYEFVDKLRYFIDSIPADEFEGSLDDAQSEI